MRGTRGTGNQETMWGNMKDQGKQDTNLEIVRLENQGTLWCTTENKGLKNQEARDPRNQETKQESGTKGTGTPMDLKNHF